MRCTGRSPAARAGELKRYAAHDNHEISSQLDLSARYSIVDVFRRMQEPEFGRGQIENADRRCALCKGVCLTEKP